MYKIFLTSPCRANADKYTTNADNLTVPRVYHGPPTHTLYLTVPRVYQTLPSPTHSMGILGHPDLAEAFKASIYNTIHFSAKTTGAIGMKRFVKKYLDTKKLLFPEVPLSVPGTPCPNCYLIEMGSAITYGDGTCSICGRMCSDWQ